MKKEITKETITGALVADDYRTATIFKSYGIDFCCKGNRTINEVCENKNIQSDLLIADLNKVVNQQEGQTIDFQSWPLDLLADYIEKKHHRYVSTRIPEILAFLEKLCRVHGGNHPELIEIQKHFSACASALTLHMKKEEMILFPYIRMLVSSKISVAENPTSDHMKVQDPITVMMQEHETEGERLRMISGLSNDYTPPMDACATYKVTYSLLKEFEEDLHLHIHLENNILFPKAIQVAFHLNTFKRYENTSNRN